MHFRMPFAISVVTITICSLQIMAAHEALSKNFTVKMYKSSTKYSTVVGFWKIAKLVNLRDTSLDSTHVQFRKFTSDMWKGAVATVCCLVSCSSEQCVACLNVLAVIFP